jgi:hypothetical protein
MAGKKKEEDAEVKETKGIPVKAIRPCYYGEIYRERGCKFEVANENEISKGMERLDSKPHPTLGKVKKKEEKPDPRVKELKDPETIKDATNLI